MYTVMQNPVWRRDPHFFPPLTKQSEEQAFYFTQFRTCEINTTFYANPAAATYASWTSKAPEGFAFALKFSKALTHDALFAIDQQRAAWDAFIEGAQLLGSHLGPILVQLPPKLAKNMELLRHFSAIVPETYRIVFDFRHESWYVCICLTSRYLVIYHVNMQCPSAPGTHKKFMTF
jgi:uncharacterized protein YecE (DUF72 family)